MPRLMGNSTIYTQYPCGKVIEMVERDAMKWKKMHFRVCKTCRNSIEVDMSSRSAGGDTRLTKNGGICKDKPMNQQIKEICEDLLVSGIRCKTCKFELPQMKMSEHLDKNNPKNKCKC